MVLLVSKNTRRKTKVEITQLKQNNNNNNNNKKKTKQPNNHK